MNKEPLVVLIEDEQQIRRFLRLTLADHSFQLIEASSGSEGLTRVTANHPDLVLLDLGLPDVDGIDVVRAIRRQSSVPIIILSARDQEQEKIRALDVGADDYVTKPFGMGELLARMRAALRRSLLTPADSAPSVYDFGDVKLDVDQHRVVVAGNEVHLTPNEFSLLELLMKNAGRVLTHNQLLKGVWGDTCLGETHYVRVYMAQLRHKLEQDPTRPRHLITESGIGYRFKA